MFSLLRSRGAFCHAVRLSDSADIYGIGFREGDDLYGTAVSDPVRSIKTYYEQQWLSRGKQIKLLRFRLSAEGELVEPEADDIPKDDYRSTKGRPQGSNRSE